MKQNLFTFYLHACNMQSVWNFTNSKLFAVLFLSCAFCTRLSKYLVKSKNWILTCSHVDAQSIAEGVQKGQENNLCTPSIKAGHSRQSCSCWHGAVSPSQNKSSRSPAWSSRSLCSQEPSREAQFPPAASHQGETEGTKHPSNVTFSTG